MLGGKAIIFCFLSTPLRKFWPGYWKRMICQSIPCSDKVCENYHSISNMHTELGITAGIPTTFVRTAYFPTAFPQTLQEWAFPIPISLSELYTSCNWHLFLVIDDSI